MDGCGCNRERAQETEWKQGTGLYLCISAILQKLCLSSVAKGRRRKRIKVEQERRAIRVRRRKRKTEDTNLSGVRDGNHLLYECACAHTHRQKKRERERKGTCHRSSLIRGEKLPPVAPLLAFQMKAADKRACCTRQLKRRVSQLGMSCWRRKERGVWTGCWWSERGPTHHTTLCPSKKRLLAVLLPGPLLKEGAVCTKCLCAPWNLENSQQTMSKYGWNSSGETPSDWLFK